MKPNLIIAIDGHSSCGKSTLAKDIAKTLNYKYIDTGAMYRAVTLYALEEGMISDGIINESKLQSRLNAGEIKIRFQTDETNQQSVCFLNGTNVADAIRKPRVNNYVSPISAIAFVREAMLTQQREMGKAGGVVMEGRDIGTAVFPDADVKIFLTANIDTRAQRRFDELKKKNITISMEEVKQNLAERDHIDSTRKKDPLKKADDAIVLDNSLLNREEQTQKAVRLIHEKIQLQNK